MSVMLPLRFLHGVLSTCLSLVAPEIWSFWLQIHVRSVKCCNQPSSSPLFYLSCLINVPGTICEILQNVGHLSTNMNPVALFFSFFFGDLYNRIKHLPNIWKYRKTVIQLCTSSVTFCFCSCLASTCVCFVFFTRLKMSSGSWGCSFIKSPVCNSDHLLLNLTVKELHMEEMCVLKEEKEWRSHEILLWYQLMWPMRSFIDLGWILLVNWWFERNSWTMFTWHVKYNYQFVDRLATQQFFYTVNRKHSCFLYHKSHHKNQ